MPFAITYFLSLELDGEDEEEDESEEDLVSDFDSLLFESLPLDSDLEELPPDLRA